ncbi:MAG TPA: hypothetical protein VM118_13630 [Acidobacteriota bacterium]|nr:hypothetical protein [Acidobacteriota bacterium]
MKWDCRDYVRRVNNTLSVLAAKDWKYLLSQQKPPVYAEGIKAFKLYTPKQRVQTAAQLGPGSSAGGFFCTASLSSPAEKNLSPLVTHRTLKNIPNSSSRVPITELRKFVGDLSNEKSLGFPVFSVCDCNSFHTSGYLWGLYAIKKAFKVHGPGAVAVLNFDQHQDEGKTGLPVVPSDGWGVPLLTEQELQAAGGCYLSIGNGQSGNVLCRFQAPGAGFKGNQRATISGSMNKSSWETFWEGVKDDVGDIKFVFISVDRDCLVNHYTQWGDACFFKDITRLKSCIEIVLGSLMRKIEGVRVIGFDITGLPEHPKMISHRGRPVIAAGNVWGRADKEVTDLLGLAAPHLRTTAQVIAKK